MEKTLNIKGMTCDHCKKAVTNALKNLDGVTKVSVSLDKGEAEVEFNEGKVTDEKMKDAVEDQGYDVT